MSAVIKAFYLIIPVVGKINYLFRSLELNYCKCANFNNYSFCCFLSLARFSLLISLSLSWVSGTQNTRPVLFSHLKPGSFWNSREKKLISSLQVIQPL